MGGGAGRAQPKSQAVAQRRGHGLGGHIREGGVEVSKRQCLAMVKESWLWGGEDQQRRWCVGG